MKSRLARSVIAVTLAIVVAATGTLKPAPAQAEPVRAQYNIGAIIAAVKTVIDLWKRLFTPDQLDHPVQRHHLPGPQQQDREDAAALPAAERHRPAAVPAAHRAKNREFHWHTVD